MQNNFKLFATIYVVFLCISHKLPTTEGQDSSYFRIIAPQNICNPGENETQTTPDGITISFQPKDGMKLSYKFQIFFKTLGNVTFTQREMLLVWRAVRTLGRRLNTLDRLAISNQNALFINKTELFPGISYIFHVVGITDAGVASKEDIFVIQYKEGVLENKNIPDGINFLLIGSELATANSVYNLYAKVVFCKPNYDYYLRWKVQNIDEEYQDLQHIISSTLTIEPNILESGEENLIEAFVMAGNSTQILAKQTIVVNVMQRGFQIFLIPTAARIGVETLLSLELFIVDYDNNLPNFEIFWEYFDAEQPTEKISEVYRGVKKLKMSFKRTGRYHVVANVKLSNGANRKMIAEIDVVNNVFSGFHLPYYSNINVATNQKFLFTIFLTNLIPGCKAEWLSVPEAGFKVINAENNAAINLGRIAIADLERTYLSEIVDFGTTTWRGEVTIEVQPLHFEGDSMYKFRLLTLCPIENAVNHFLSSYYEIIVNTNAPPVIGGLKVTPNNGIALRSIFQVDALKAKDILMDEPLTYELCGNFDDYKICFGKYTEYKNWEILLPYTTSPIELSLKVCDIRAACNSISTQNITVIYEELTNEEFSLRKQKIIAGFLRTDFFEAFNDILLTTITFRNANSKLLNNWRQFVNDLLQKEINKILEYPNNRFHVPTSSILDFVLLAKINLEALELNNINNKEKLLEIIDQIAYEVPVYDGSITLAPIIESLDVNDRYRKGPLPVERSHGVDMTFANLNLWLISDIYQANGNGKSINGEITDVTQRITVLLKNMCFSDLIINEIIETTMISLQVQKLNGFYLLHKGFKIPKFFTKADGMLTLNANANSFVSVEKHYCLAIAQYAHDHFTQENAIVTYVQIYDLNALTVIFKNFVQQQQEQQQQQPVVQLQLSKIKAEENNCLMYINNVWSAEFCKTKQTTAQYVKCECVQFGFFRLFSKNNNVNEVTPIKTATTSFNSAEYPIHATVNPYNLSAIVNSHTTTHRTPLTSTTNDILSLDNENSKDPLHNGILSTTQPKNNVIRSTKKQHMKDPKDEVLLTNLSTTKNATFGYYMYPSIAILLVAILLVIFIIYKRFPAKTKENPVVATNQNLPKRQRATSIKYAAIYDEHIMSGNF